MQSSSEICHLECAACDMLWRSLPPNMGLRRSLCASAAGTLTQNEMAVVRLWAAGSEFRDLAALREARCGNGAPGPGLALDPAVAALITDGIAVNSTAELRPSANGARPAAGQGRLCMLLHAGGAGLLRLA